MHLSNFFRHIGLEREQRLIFGQETAGSEPEAAVPENTVQASPETNLSALDLSKPDALSQLVMREAKSIQDQNAQVTAEMVRGFERIINAHVIALGNSMNPETMRVQVGHLNSGLMGRFGYELSLQSNGTYKATALPSQDYYSAGQTRKDQGGEQVQKEEAAVKTHEQAVDATANDAGVTPEAPGTNVAATPVTTEAPGPEVATATANDVQAKRPLEERYPEVTEAIKHIPLRLQGIVRQMLESLDDDEIQQLKGFSTKIADMFPNPLDNATILSKVFDSNDHLLPAEEIMQLSMSSQNPEEQKMFKFYGELSGPERTILDKIIGAAGEYYDKSVGENPDNPEKQQTIDKHFQAWKDADTKETRQMEEGYLLMEGAEIDADGKLKILSATRPERLGSIIRGMIMVLTAFIDKYVHGKKTAIDKQASELTDDADKPKAPVAELTPEQRETEITTVEGDLKKAEETNAALEKDIKEIKGKIQSATPEEKPALETRLAELTKEQDDLQAAMVVMTARLDELRQAEHSDTIAPLPEEEKKMDIAKANYLEAEGKSGSNVKNDLEYETTSVGAEHGYIPYLEALLTEVQDNDEWTGDSDDEEAKEKTLLQSAAVAVQKNLQGLATALDQSPTKTGPAYEALRKVYTEKSSRLTELLGSVDSSLENSELRDPAMVAEQTKATIEHMTADEAIDWVTKMMATIDDNNWQSNGLKETYGVLSKACQDGLKMKLAEEETAAMKNPALAKEYFNHCMEVAKLFTNRGTAIDSDLTNIDFAVELAKDAIGFPELAVRYQEKLLQTKNPLTTYIETHKAGVVGNINNMTEEQRENPEVKSMLKTLTAEETSTGEQAQTAFIKKQSELYAIIRTLEAIFNGEAMPNIQAELDGSMGPFLDEANAAFETFLNGSWGAGQDASGINAAIGDPPLSAAQTDAWELLSDMQGYGYFNPSDHTWSNVAAGAKIGGMIVAGVAVGVATGGLGVVAAAVAGGVTMTVANAAINQQGFDNIEEATKVYGTALVVNTGTMGAARYLAAGRAAYQLSKGGLLAESGGLTGVLKIAGEKGGGKLLASLDDASSLGTRLVGAAGEGAADVVVGASLDTVLTGGTFVDNLQSNAMFFGLNFAEFGPNALKGLRSVPAEKLHGLAQQVNTVNLERVNLQKMCGNKVNIKDLLVSEDPSGMLRTAGLGEPEIQTALGTVAVLKKAKGEFEASFKEAADMVQANDAKPNGTSEEGTTKPESETPENPQTSNAQVPQNNQPLPAPPGYEVRRMKSKLNVARQEARDAAKRVADAKIKMDTAEAKFGKGSAPDDIKSEFEEAQRAFGEAKKSLDAVQRESNTLNGVPPAPATDASSTVSRPLPAPQGYEARRMRSKLTYERQQAKDAAKRVADAKTKFTAAEAKFGKGLAPEDIKKEIREAKSAFEEAKKSLDAVQRESNTLNGVPPAPARDGASKATETGAEQGAKSAESTEAVTTTSAKDVADNTHVLKDRLDSEITRIENNIQSAGLNTSQRYTQRRMLNTLKFLRENVGATKFGPDACDKILAMPVGRIEKFASIQKGINFEMGKLQKIVGESVDAKQLLGNSDPEAMLRAMNLSPEDMASAVTSLSRVQANTRKMGREFPDIMQKKEVITENIENSQTKTSQPERLQAAEKQINKRLAEEGLEASEKEFLEYSLKDIQIQKNTTLTALEKAEARFQALESYGSSGSPFYESTARKLIELHNEISDLKAAEHNNTKPLGASQTDTEQGTPDADTARTDAMILAANIEFERSVREKIDTSNGAYIPEIGMSDEFLMKNAGLTEGEIIRAKNAGILQEGEHGYVLAKADQSSAVPSVDSKQRTPNGVEAKTKPPRRVIKNLQEANERIDELNKQLDSVSPRLTDKQRAHREYMRDDTKIVIDKSIPLVERTQKRLDLLQKHENRESTTNRVQLQERKNELALKVMRLQRNSLAKNIGPKNAYGLTSAVEWANTAFSKLSTQVRAKVAPFLTAFKNSVQDLRTSTPANLRAAMKKAETTFETVKKFITKSEYEDKQAAKKAAEAGTPAPELKLDPTEVSTPNNVTDVSGATTVGDFSPSIIEFDNSTKEIEENDTRAAA